MIRRNFCYAFGILLIVLCGCKKELSKTVASSPDYYVAAFVWPSCHDDSLGREYLWKEGIGEWEVIKKGNPRFEDEDGNDYDARAYRANPEGSV